MNKLSTTVLLCIYLLMCGLSFAQGNKEPIIEGDFDELIWPFTIIEDSTYYQYPVLDSIPYPY